MPNPNCDKLGHLTTGTRVMCAECYNKQANAVKRVRELHKPFSKLEIICDSCACIYPCPTIEALDCEQ